MTTKINSRVSSFSPLSGGGLCGVLMLCLLSPALAGCEDHSPSPPGTLSNVNDVVPALQWEGYENGEADQVASLGSYGPVTVEDIRQSGSDYALISLAKDF